MKDDRAGKTRIYGSILRFERIGKQFAGVVRSRCLATPAGYTD
jgi:hypothetical protein